MESNYELIGAMVAMGVLVFFAVLRFSKKSDIEFYKQGMFWQFLSAIYALTGAFLIREQLWGIRHFFLHTNNGVVVPYTDSLQDITGIVLFVFAMVAMCIAAVLNDKEEKVKNKVEN